MTRRPEKSSQIRFAWALVAVIVIYGLFAVILSVHVIDQQSSARTDLYAALETLDQLHQEAMASASSADVRSAITRAWQDHRAFAAGSSQQARLIADQLITRLNQEYPHPACGQKRPAFVAPEELPKQRACMVVVGIKNNQVRVTGYDTQGMAMDNFYEFLYAPTGRSD
ncbi:hypothetical protein B1757_02010 [Acidithiobacillus marinus]|uniref:Uncharacterized protein n=1 Tax=Acidithiobacillus marinus TaxID=187490 RepID=A0A2I1DQJ8_9PROT|nr:hypothetical protein [Acidithiobacillus marinus]PKY12137.1 hypothetical protein B1757_02010 [Acidithiobacillus marinus]